VNSHPLALADSQFKRFRTADIDYARKKVSEVYCDHRLSLKCGQLDAFHYHMPFEDISFNYMGYGPQSDIEPGHLGDFYLIQLPIKGSATIIADNQTIESRPGKASVINSSVYTKMTWSDGCEQLMLQISKNKVNTVLSSLLGRPASHDLVFSPFMENRNRQHASWWKHIIAFINDYNQPFGFYKSAEMIDHELTNIVRGLLYTLDHNYSERIKLDNRTVLPKSLRCAVEYIKQHASENLTIDELVRITDVSERSLFNSFKQCLDITPMQYVQKRRLANARLQLLDRSLSFNLSVTQIAFDNGFSQLGRFSALYKSVYGELPSVTKANTMR
jgi:AraC-like DNA-binding protein